jgi:glycosyltransferase involved in cell wall biosynthesis
LVLQDKLVSVLTPVYNGALYLDECIQSVLRQTYYNIEFVIVDNCSTDESFDIAKAAAESDSRINVVRSVEHVGPIQNWNRALGHVSKRADYIKFVHADDWLFDTCIERMVDVAEQDERIGLVSAYRLEEDCVSLDRLPSAATHRPGVDTFTMDGRSVARAILMENASVLGSPTSVLLRTRTMGPLEHFYSADFLHADKESALRILQHSDFGFIKQVLTYTRRHNESVTSLTNSLDTRRQENLLLLKKYGDTFLSDADFQRTWSRELNRYYRFLARNIGTGKGPRFWESHAANLVQAGSPLKRGRLWRAFVRRWLNPLNAMREMRRHTGQREAVKNEGVHGFLDLSRNSAPTSSPERKTRGA